MDQPSDSQPTTAEARPGVARRRLRRRVLTFALVGLLVAGGAAYAGIRLRWWKPPYPASTKWVCWQLGCPEPAYNFAEVVPGAIYRSGRPDERWYRYAHQRYGIRHVVRLFEAGGPVPMPPNDLGMTVHAFNWTNQKAPPRKELDEVLAILDANQPVMVHCWAGADRTGYAIAAYRILRQGWTAQQALDEMSRYWHSPDDKPWMRESLLSLAADPNR